MVNVLGMLSILTHKYMDSQKKEQLWKDQDWADVRKVKRVGTLVNVQSSQTTFSAPSFSKKAEWCLANQTRELVLQGVRPNSSKP